jgi:transcriptional regulator with PAS, ATPase and Fis domain
MPWNHRIPELNIQHCQQNANSCGVEAMIALTAEVRERVLSFPLMEYLTEVSAGSLPENGIYLPFKGISRRHFSIVKKNEGWLLRDDGSTNGILLNGNKVRIATLHPGDIIEVGIVKLHVSDEKEETDSIAIEAYQERNEDQETDKLSVIPIQIESDIYSFPKLVLPQGFILGKSAAIVRVCQKLHALVNSDVNVLFVGETGTGKEMFARMLHLSSKRASAPFVVVNCAAIPSELLEAEIFGIAERVATGVGHRIGKFASAKGGTLFLDELEAFSISLQSKILRAVEDKCINPVGETHSYPVNFRLISATNQEPQKLILNRCLREDLYHRLATVELCLPALRDRKSDIQLLIIGMLDDISKRENKKFSGVSKAFISRLLQYSYPGNLRELNNILRAVVALGHPGEILDVSLLPEKLLHSGSSPIADSILEILERNSFNLKQAMGDVSRRFVIAVLKHHNGNIQKAAEQMQLSEFGLRKTMKRLGISKIH